MSALLIAFTAIAALASAQNFLCTCTGVNPLSCIAFDNDCALGGTQLGAIGNPSCTTGSSYATCSISSSANCNDKFVAFSTGCSTACSDACNDFACQYAATCTTSSSCFPATAIVQLEV